jgi:hypothetical protein
MRIMKLVTTKMRRGVYARKTVCIREEAENTEKVRDLAHPLVFKSILEIAQSEYEKQSTYHQARCKKKLMGLVRSQCQQPKEENQCVQVQPNQQPPPPPSPPPKLFSNLTDIQLTEAEENLLSKGPNFSYKQIKKEKVIMEMQTGFQKMIHDIRWHCYQTSLAQEPSHSSKYITKVEYPMVSNRKEISLPPLIPEVEEVIKSCHHKYVKVLEAIKRRKLSSNLRPDERRAFQTLTDKGLRVVPSDKGGDLCTIKHLDYNLAISEHLRSNPIYRKVTISKIETLEDKINTEWRRVCRDNKIPKKIENMYASSCSNYASIQAAIKTHKYSEGGIAIRPIINSIGSPGYNLSKFLQTIIQPLVNNILISSNIVMDNIRNLNPNVLKENNYPISLDVESMYHNIPRKEALAHLKNVLTNARINLCCIGVGDIVSLVEVCINSNHFKHNGHIFYQRQGLPMGNRLSGMLAELFMDKVVKDTYDKLNFYRPTFRYVDDLLVFTCGEEDAKNIFAAFNDNPYGLIFTLELPVNREITYLDFKVKVNDDGIAMFDFHRKPTRKDNFINAHTALPTQAIHNIIGNEWDRIRKRCSVSTSLEQHNKEFQRRLKINGHPQNALKPPKVQRPPGKKSDQKFFLSIPYVNDEIQYKVRNALKELGVRIHIAHKGSKLKHSTNKFKEKAKCVMRGCRLNNDLCLVKGAIYEVKCNQCGQTYIGSSWRYLHTRYKEHLSQKASPIYQHNQRCRGQLIVKVLAIDENIQRMRIKEAMLIKQLKPILNGKEDLFRSHILFFE